MDGRVEVGSKVEGMWCVDSETGDRYLIDTKTGQILTTEEQFNANQGHK